MPNFCCTTVVRRIYKKFIKNYYQKKFKKYKKLLIMTNKYQYQNYNIYFINKLILLIILLIFSMQYNCCNGANLSELLLTTSTTTTTTNNNYNNFILNNKSLNSFKNSAIDNSPVTATTTNATNDDDNINGNQDVYKLLEIVMEGLKMDKLPDVSKINISQMEYSQKYQEYLSRINDKKLLHNYKILRDDDDDDDDHDDEDNDYEIHLQSYKHKFDNIVAHRTIKSNVIFLQFPLNESLTSSFDVIEEANLRLIIITEPNLINNHVHHHSTIIADQQQQQQQQQQHEQEQQQLINLIVKQITTIDGISSIELSTKEILVKRYNKEVRWLDFDIRHAVLNWLNNSSLNLGIEIHCDNCNRLNIKISSNNLQSTIVDNLANNDDSDDDDDDDENSGPVLNIIGYRHRDIHRQRIKRSSLSLSQSQQQQQQQQHHYHQQQQNIMASSLARKKRKTDCYEGNQKCCRHSMEVIFRELKGFEFIIQPKIFDAGYCRGKCPPRYNPAHHHAVLQSLIWKQDRKKAPRPCCAPSKLVELEILHVDEKDSRKLKVSTWNDMRVVECACS